MRKHSEQKLEPCFKPNDLVLVHKPFYERGGGVILPQSDGPLRVVAFSSTHTVILEDPLTGEPYLQGRPVAVSRIIRFDFPSDWVDASMEPVSTGKDLVSHLRVGHFVAVELRVVQHVRVYVARVERVFHANEQVEVVLYHVPADCRCGPWQRRTWHPWTCENGALRKEIVSVSELLCQVVLLNSALDTASLEALARLGVETGVQPHRDSSLPPRS